MVIKTYNSTKSIPQQARPNWLLPFLAALTVFVLQLMSGTGPLYAMLLFILLMVSYKAILSAGGLSSLPGICVFYLLLQHILVAQIAKIWLWEPADAPLKQPIATLGVYIVGMSSLGVGAYFSRRALRRWTRPFFPAETDPARLFWISIICTAAATILMLLTHTVGVDARTGDPVQGGALGPLKQFSIVIPLSVVAGTAYVLKTSGGRRSLGWINGITIAIQFCFGIISAGRNMTIVAVVMYLFTCFAFCYRFRIKHFVVMAMMAYVSLYIIFPYALVARGIVRTGNFQNNIGLAANLALDVVLNPVKYHEMLNTHRKHARTKLSYYTNTSDALYRYAMLDVCDGIVDATINSGTTGTKTIIPGFQMLLPRIINEDKPFVEQGNFLAHREDGLLPGKHDYTTGITVGFFADAFSSFEWLGITLIPCIIMFCFTSAYTLMTNTRIWDNIFAISLLQSAAWAFSEGTIDLQILAAIQSPIVTTIALFLIQGFTIMIIHVQNRIKKIYPNNTLASYFPERAEKYVTSHLNTPLISSVSRIGKKQ